MWLLDQWAERHIRDAQKKGEFDDLPGSGEPLALDDDSHIAPELRAGYRLLKNAGCLPPELEQRREAVELADLLKRSAMTIHDILNLAAVSPCLNSSCARLG